jgi:hypothetical protein
LYSREIDAEFTLVVALSGALDSQNDVKKKTKPRWLVWIVGGC